MPSPADAPGMTSETVLIPGGRDVRATLDRTTPDERAAACVVACPPHPQQRGHRGDERLTAVSEALGERGLDCLRFDYGDWDEGYGEATDADNAVGWAAERYDAVGLFGYSFGGCLALATAAQRPGLHAVSALAPTARLNPDVDAVTALDGIACPVQVLYGERDTTADWESVVERAWELDHAVTGHSADHFFVGKAEEIGGAVAGFLADRV